MSKIISCRTSVKEDKVLAVISIEGSDKPIFLTAKQVFSATGLQNNFSILKGSDIHVEYYKKGDKLINGSECTKDDTILKEYSIDLSASVLNIATASAFGASMFGK